MLSLVSIQTHAMQSLALHALCKRETQGAKGLIGCFDDWLLQSTIPIGWRLRALRLNGNRALGTSGVLLTPNSIKV